MRAFFVSVLFALGLAACGEDKPQFLIPTEEMVPILKEMQIAYSGVDYEIKDVAKRKSKYAEMNALILDKYAVNVDTFFMSYEYYQEHPEILDSIYMRVIEELNLEMMPLQQRNNKGRVLEEQ